MKLFASLFFTVLVLASCASSTKKSYIAVPHDGRIYVLGSAESAAKFKATHHLALTKTMIGEGPNGESVVLEVSKEDPELANRLWVDYANDNIKYFERYHDGRVYVMGSLATLEAFKKTHHLPLTKTYISEGVNGESVVIEESKDDATLSTRLWAAYKAKHKK